MNTTGTKGIVSEKNDEDNTKEKLSANSIRVELNDYGKLAIYRDYSKEDYETTKLKRLVRK